ncbi:venom phosphodiesterase CdcPDE isoform X4 [Vanacampus margaritifer]
MKAPQKKKKQIVLVVVLSVSLLTLILGLGLGLGLELRACRDLEAPQTSCRNRCYQPYDGDVPGCRCDAACQDSATCCHDYHDLCKAPGELWECTRLRCGETRLPTSRCHCSDDCAANVDCCSNYRHVCQGQSEWVEDECDDLSHAICPPGFRRQPLLLVSLDGLRADYLQLWSALVPVLSKLRKCGTSTPYMQSAFPSKTFPNHYSIVTGLYPESNGLIDNVMYDPVMDAIFTLSGPEKENPAWYLGQPIWHTAKYQGLKSGTFFWPGSDVKLNGSFPDIYRPYDGKVPFEERVLTVLKWLQLPDQQRPDFYTLYLEEPDKSGHRFGPVSGGVRPNQAPGGAVHKRRGQDDGSADERTQADGTSPMRQRHGGRRSRHGGDQLRQEGKPAGVSGGHQRLRGDRGTLRTHPEHQQGRALGCRRTCGQHDAGASKTSTCWWSPNGCWRGFRARCASAPAASTATTTTWPACTPCLSLTGQSLPPAPKWNPSPTSNSTTSYVLQISPAANNGTHGSLNHILRQPFHSPLRPQEQSAPAECRLSSLQPQDLLGCSCPGLNEDGVTAANRRLNMTSAEEAASQQNHLTLGRPRWLRHDERYCVLHQQAFVSAYSLDLKMALWSSFSMDAPTNAEPLPPAPSDCLRADVRILPSDSRRCDNYGAFRRAFLYPPGLTPVEAERHDALLSSHVVPMYPQFHRIWAYFHGTLLKKYAAAYNGVNVLTGPAFDYDHDGRHDQPELIRRWAGPSNVSVPTHYFAVLTSCRNASRALAECDGPLHAVAFLLPHRPDNSENCKSAEDEASWVEDHIWFHQARVRDVEWITGLDFYQDSQRPLHELLQLKTRPTAANQKP